MTKTSMILALSLAALAGVAEAKVPKNLQFDGYCDGMTGLTKNANLTGVAGTWSNLDCAGTNAALVGAQAKVKGAATSGYIMGSTGLAALLGFEVTWSVAGDSTWTIYAGDGSILNSGTYTAVQALAPQGSKSSVQR